MIDFLINNWSELVTKTGEHFYISIVALLIAVVVTVPIGIFLSKLKRTSNFVLMIAGVLQTIPTL